MEQNTHANGMNVEEGYVPLPDYLDRAALIGARILNDPRSARAA